MALRATTNLIVPTHLQLPRSELKQNFLYVYGKGYTGPEPVFINRLWLASFLPEIVADPSFGKSSKMANKKLREWAKYAAKNMRAGYLTLQKINDADDPHFQVAIPLAEFNRLNIEAVVAQYRYWFTDEKGEYDVESATTLSDKLKDTTEELTSHKIPASQVIGNLHNLDTKGREELTKTLIQLRLEYKGSLAVVFADFKITKAEAQQLTTTEWLQIRPIDLYPLLLQWVAGQYGYTVSAPLAAFPISKIASTLPPVLEGDARVNEDGISIDSKGLPYWLPIKLDSTSRYEDLYSQVGDKGDGKFGLLDVSSVSSVIDMGGEVSIKLPANIPVLIDWQNNKYAYSLSTGMLKIQDLSRYKAADAAHIRNILTRTDFEEKLLKNIVSLASASGVAPKVVFEAEELAAISNDDASLADKFSDPAGVDIWEYWDGFQGFWGRNVSDRIMLKDISITGEAIIRPLAHYMLRAQPAILANLDAVNMRYAVATVSSVLGFLTVIKYASDFTKLNLEASKICAAAENQSVKEGWEPPSIPLLADKIGFLPHQKKVRNLLKDSPDFAILPIQAGGGKSVLTITDILYEIKADRSQPYLILCPAHLVAQYVKEIVFFTAGKLNVVPINTYTIRHNGFKRLTAMLDGAPRNTVVVCNYDVLARGPQQLCYGTSSVTVYPVIEFLRQFRFGYAMLDESHSVKNDSQRTRACMTLIADIKKKRLASGTMAHDSPSDLAMQIGMLDPTLFGSKDVFNARYGEDVKGERVVSWKPGAQQQIMKAIQSRVVVGKAMRKEWAALLPTAEEKFHRVEMSDAQLQVYNAILTEALDKMKEDAKGNKTLQKFFEKQGVKIEVPQAGGDEGTNEEEDEEAEDAADENAGAALEAMLKFYLARLEQYLTAPVADELGDRLLTGDDRRSPKVNEIINIMHEHINANLPGKVLVFTNFIASAEAIYEALPPDLKKMSLLYVAADKETTGQQFETDDSKKIMIGVENSMNTGLNLQHVSRLIRVETVWNPGTLEQGNSRVNRPELKKAERRERIFFDWVMANRTMDITKISRLISKVIAVAKFENADNLDYENIPDVPIIPMNSDTIQAMNDWDMNLMEYAQSYKEYKQVQHTDYAEYREKHGALKLDPLTVAPVPIDAKVLAQTPYTPGLELYKGGDLGLVRIDEYLRQDVSDEDETGVEESEEDEGEGKEAQVNLQKQRLKERYRTLIGHTVHTEFGDGIVKSVGVRGKYVNVLLPSGHLVRARIAAAFLVTKKIKDMRAALLKEVGLPVTENLNILGARFRIDNAGARRAAKEAEEKEKEIIKIQKTKKSSNFSIELTFNVSNGYLGITYFVNDKKPEANAALQAMGFRPVPEFALAHVKTAAQLLKQFNLWDKAGFTIDPIYRKLGVANAFLDLYNMLKTGKVSQGAANFKFSTKNQLMNFFRSEVKPSVSKSEFKPFPMIEDDEAYIVMHLRGQPANLRATKIKSPGIRWQEGAQSMVFYGLDLKATGDKIKEIRAASIQIANIEELKEHFKRLKKTKLRQGQKDII